MWTIAATCSTSIWWVISAAIGDSIAVIVEKYTKLQKVKKGGISNCCVFGGHVLKMCVCVETVRKLTFWCLKVGPHCSADNIF